MDYLRKKSDLVYAFIRFNRKNEQLIELEKPDPWFGLSEIVSEEAGDTVCVSPGDKGLEVRSVFFEEEYCQPLSLNQILDVYLPLFDKVESKCRFKFDRNIYHIRVQHPVGSIYFGIDILGSVYDPRVPTKAALSVSLRKKTFNKSELSLLIPIAGRVPFVEWSNVAEQRFDMKYFVFSLMTAFSLADDVFDYCSSLVSKSGKKVSKDQVYNIFNQIENPPEGFLDYVDMNLVGKVPFNFIPQIFSASLGNQLGANTFKLYEQFTSLFNYGI